MKILQIKETCLYVNDLVVCMEFYEGILGFEQISYVPERHVFFRVGDSVLLCFNPEATKMEEKLPPHFAAGPQHIAFEVLLDDYSKIKSELLEKGVPITHMQEWSNGQFESFYFNDPAGNVLEIVPFGMWD